MTTYHRLTIYLFLSFIFSLLANPCFAQVDSLYIAPYEKKNAVSAYLGKSYLFLSHAINENEEIQYHPNNPMTIGLGVSVANTLINVSYGHGFQFLSEKEKGKTKALDFQLHHYGRKVMVDVFIQKYKGYYSEDSNSENIELFPDLKLRQYGIHADYVFNHQKFSTKAAFNQGERQLKSAGSFLVGGGAYITKIEVDSTSILKEDNSLSNFQLGVSAGYAYTWVINKHWSLSGSATLGMNLGNNDSGIFGKEKLEIYPTFLPRIAVGYATDLWSLRLSTVNNIIFSDYSERQNTNLGLFSGNVQLTFIRRLDSFAFFKKRPH